MFTDWKANLVKLTMPSKVIYRLNTISIKIPPNGNVFGEIEKLILKFMWNHKGSPKDKIILTKKNPTEVRPPVLHFKTHYKTAGSSRAWSIQRGKDSLFNTQCGSWTSTGRRTRLDPYLTLHRPDLMELQL